MVTKQASEPQNEPVAFFAWYPSETLSAVVGANDDDDGGDGGAQVNLLSALRKRLGDSLWRHH